MWGSERLVERNIWANGVVNQGVPLSVCGTLLVAVGDCVRVSINNKHASINYGFNKFYNLLSTSLLREKQYKGVHLIFTQTLKHIH